MDDLELYKRYRPKLLKEIVGQPDAVKALKVFLEKGKVPRSMLFSGPSGCGKTTLARIMGEKVDSKGSNFNEVNAADFNGIELIRDIRRRMNHSAIGCKSRCWLIDEAQDLTKNAQSAFLKILEDTPRHVYFFLATTHPQDLLPTIRTRCTEIKCSAIPDNDLETLVRRVCEAEDKEITDEVVEKLIKESDCSARQALVLLHKIIDLTDEEEQLSALAVSKSESAVIELYKAISWAKPQWSAVSKTIKAINPTNSDVEGIRRLILACAKNSLLSGSKTAPKAFIIIDVFRDNFFDSGVAGLVGACYEIVVGHDK
jgi:DNA polymerase-3 subunit gamma/tau